MAQLLTNGVDGLSRVATTSASGEWSVAGLTLSIHGDITYTGATFKLRYVVGTSSGAASSSGNQIWLGTVPQQPLQPESDYFGGDTLDSKWTEWDVPGSMTIGQSDGRVTLTQSSAAGQSNTGIFQTAPADNFFAITASVTLSGLYGSFSVVSIFVGEDLGAAPSTASIHSTSLVTTSTSMSASSSLHTNYNTQSTNLTVETLTGNVGYLRLFVDRVAETVLAMVSVDGRNWLALISRSFASGVLTSVDTIGIAVNNNGLGEDLQGSCEMFRVDITSDPYLPVGGFVGTNGGSRSETYDIEKLYPSFIADTMTAEFNGTLDPFILGGSTVLGTADLITIPASPTIDLSTRHGSALFQPLESTTAQIYTSLSLADGEEIIVSMSRPYAQGATGNNDIAYGICLNDSTTDYTAGTHDWFYYDGGNEEIDHWNGSVEVNKMNPKMHPGGNFYWRLIRDGDDIHAFFSFNGQVWCAFSEMDTVVRGHDTFWIFYKVATLTGSKKVGPMEARWCRHKTYDGIYPW